MSRPYLSALFAPLLLGLCGCAGSFVAGGPSLDSGTLAVSGVQTGVGAQVEAGRFWIADGRGWGLALGGALAGWRSDGDGDPIFLTTLEARYRRELLTHRATRPFLEAGGGAIAAFIAGPRQGGVTGHVAIGIEGGSELHWWLALRERPALLVGRQAEFSNALQGLVGIQLGN